MCPGSFAEEAGESLRGLTDMTAAGDDRRRNGRVNLRGNELLEVLRRLPRARLLKMKAAGMDALECMNRLAARGSSVVAELVGRQHPPQAWTHYPSHDAIDVRRRVRYYYHCHGRRPAPWPGEHGHFHLFGASGAGVRTGQPTLVHLIALSVDARGMPIHIFAPNRWVTGGAWRSARTVLRRLDGFRVRARRSSALVDRWLTAVIGLFYPQLCLTLEKRDLRLQQLSVARSESSVFEDRRIHALSCCRITLAWQFEALDRALAT
jgi:hypothetical protein